MYKKIYIDVDKLCLGAYKKEAYVPREDVLDGENMIDLMLRSTPGLLFVSGYRGSGKTTYIRHLEDAAKSYKHRDNKQPHNDLVFLRVAMASHGEDLSVSDLYEYTVRKITRRLYEKITWDLLISRDFWWRYRSGQSRWTKIRESFRGVRGSLMPRVLWFLLAAMGLLLILVRFTVSAKQLTTWIGVTSQWLAASSYWVVLASLGLVVLVGLFSPLLPFSASARIRRQIRYLAWRLENDIKTETKIQLKPMPFGLIKQLPFAKDSGIDGSFEHTKTITKLDTIDIRVERIKGILKDLRGKKNIIPVVILDELDKLRLAEVEALVRSLKELLLSSDAYFVLVTGQEFGYHVHKAQLEDDQALGTMFSDLHIGLLSYEEAAMLVHELVNFEQAEKDAGQDYDELDYKEDVNAFVKYLCVETQMNPRRINSLLWSNLRKDKHGYYVHMSTFNNDLLLQYEKYHEDHARIIDIIRHMKESLFGQTHCSGMERDYYYAMILNLVTALKTRIGHKGFSLDDIKNIYEATSGESPQEITPHKPNYLWFKKDDVLNILLGHMIRAKIIRQIMPDRYKWRYHL